MFKSRDVWVAAASLLVSSWVLAQSMAYTGVGHALQIGRAHV